MPCQADEGENGSCHNQGIAMVINPERGGRSLTLNCGYGHGFSVRQVIQAVERASKHALPVKELPRRAGDPPMIVSNPAKLKARLGWAPEHDSLDEIVQSALAWESRLNTA